MACGTDERYAAALEWGIKNHNWPDAAHKDGRYVPEWNVAKHQFPKHREITPDTPKTPITDLSELAKTIKQRFNKDMPVVTSKVPLDLMDKNCVYMDPTHPAPGVPVESFGDISGNLDHTNAICETIGEPIVDAEKGTVAIGFWVKMPLYLVPCFPAHARGWGWFLYEIKDGLITSVTETYGFGPSPAPLIVPGLCCGVPPCCCCLAPCLAPSEESLRKKYTAAYTAAGGFDGTCKTHPFYPQPETIARD